MPIRRLSLICCCAVIVLQLASIAAAQVTQPPSSKSDLDYQRFEFDKHRFEIEQQQQAKALETENIKAFLTAASVIVPLLAVVATILFTVISQRQQAQIAFELKVAELAMTGSRDGYALKNKAQALTVMFRKRLPEDFAAKFDNQGFGFGSSKDQKLELLKLVADKLPDDQAILRAWKGTYPKDDWIQQKPDGTLYLQAKN